MKKAVRQKIDGQKNWLGRWIYDEKSLMAIFKKMPPKRQAKVLTKAIRTMSEKNCSKIYAIALALDCRYEDAGYFSRAKKIRLKK